MAYKLEQVTSPVTIGEGPHWDEEKKGLYFVSIEDKTIHLYTPSDGKCAKTDLGGRVGFIIPVEGKPGQFLVGLEMKFVIISWDGKDGSPAKVIEEIGSVQDGDRINDGKADPRGRVFAGTIAREISPGEFDGANGALYLIDGKTITWIESGITVSNGLAWDLKEKAFYYADSMDRKIRRYDYDVNTGEISNKRYIYDLTANLTDGVPDGLTIDETGNLWVAVFRGSCVLNIDPRTGQLLQKLPIPALQVTSCTFGGDCYEDLYVTSANSTKEFQKNPTFGSTFRIRGLGVKGMRNNKFKF